MRAERRRTKKLIVAFHFQFANQAAWKCDACRKSGLEKARRCPWRAETARAGNRPVWARKGVAVTVCPAGFITPESLAWIEQYAAWKFLGAGASLTEMPARMVDAFCVLEQELRKEADDGER